MAQLIQRASQFLAMEKSSGNLVVKDNKRYGLFEIMSELLFSSTDNSHILVCEVKKFLVDRHDLFFTLQTLIDPGMDSKLTSSVGSSMNKKSEECIKNLADTLSTSDPLHVRIGLYVIATLLSLEIYVLTDRGNDVMAWTYYPPLIQVTEIDKRFEFRTNYTEAKRGFVTILGPHSLDVFHIIASCNAKPSRPVDMGLLYYYNTIASGPDDINTQLVLQSLDIDLMQLQDFIGDFFTTPLELDDRRRTLNTAVIATSAAGIVGGILTVVGLAVSPVTFGASLGLTIAGVTIGVASGATQGVLRVREAVLQNKAVKRLKEHQDEIKDLEATIERSIKEIHKIFEERSSSSSTNCSVPGISLRGFLSIATVLRSLHSVAAVVISAARMGASVSAVASAIIGPVSMVLDIALIADAAHNKANGDKTNASKLIECIIASQIVLVTIYRGNADRSVRVTW